MISLSLFKIQKKKTTRTIEYTQIDTHVASLNLKELYIHESSKTLSFLPFYLSTLLTMNYMYIYVHICIFMYLQVHFTIK